MNCKIEIDIMNGKGVSSRYVKEVELNSISAGHRFENGKIISLGRVPEADELDKVKAFIKEFANGLANCDDENGPYAITAVELREVKEANSIAPCYHKFFTEFNHPWAKELLRCAAISYMFIELKKSLDNDFYVCFNSINGENYVLGSPNVFNAFGVEQESVSLSELSDGILNLRFKRFEVNHCYFVKADELEKYAKVLPVLKEKYPRIFEKFRG